MLISLLNFIFTLLGLLLVDKFGRRTLMLFGSLLMSASLIILSINKFIPSALLAIDIMTVFIYIGGFAISSGLLSWLIIAEIFPLGSRGRGGAIGVSSNWLGNFLIIWLIPIATSKFSLSIIFLFFAFICFLAYIFCLKYLPETKGISLEKMW